MARGDRIAAAALTLVGVPFRLHGRSVETGVDCVGLALLSAQQAGYRGATPEHYGLRGGDVALFAGWLRAAGLRPVRRAKAGDVVLVRAGPAQAHMMVSVPGGHVHAHAGLRRVVEMPGASLWPVIGIWRIAGDTARRGAA
ncbi:MAG TPA: peptidoglycan endopeptidase [Sphingobium sp.]